MRRVRSILTCVAVLGLVSGGLPVYGQIQARIRRVGLFEGATPTVRSGDWSFVEVELKNSGAAPLDGELRISQQDRDGDLVVSVQEVVIEPDGQWRPDEVYFTPNLSRGNDTLTVRLFDTDGRLVQVMTDTGEEVSELESPRFSDQPPADTLLILDLSEPRKLPHLAWLDSRRQGKADGYMNMRLVRPLSPRELPTLWQGLESVDAIVWDDADPAGAGLTAQQIGALIEWVRHGGRLLISSGKNWQSLAQSRLASALPVKITGVQQVREAQEFTVDIVQRDDFAGDLEREYTRRPITRCDMTRKRGMIAIPSQCASPQIAYRRLLGGGMLTFVGASLSQLLPAPPMLSKPNQDGSSYTYDSEDPPEFIQICEKIVASNFLGLPKVREEQNMFMGYRDPVNLFQKVRETIGFQGLGATFLIFAILFAFAYTLIATVGTYSYLKKRGWAHVCWSAFAGVSIAGTLLGTGMVWTLRGFTTRLRQTTIVDAREGEDFGYATCLLGVRTPNHTSLDLRLPVGYPDDPGPPEFGLLRAMPSSTSDLLGESTFVSPGKYQSALAGGFLAGVPVRATLKEFQGGWHGPLGGTLDAKLIVTNESKDQFGEGSYIRNNLGRTLRDCYILEGKQEIAGEDGRVTTRCLYLGTLESGPNGELAYKDLQRRLYYPLDQEGEEASKPIPNSRLQLGHVMKSWRKSLGDRGQLTAGGGTVAQVTRLLPDQQTDALLLLSTYNLIVPTANNLAFRRGHGRSLDCTHRVTRDTAVLIGFSDARPPAVLSVDRTNLFPKRAITMYRFVIPVIRK